MLVRFLMIALLAVSVSACSTTDEQETGEQIRVTEREDITQGGPLDGTEVIDSQSLDYSDGSVAPGTQQDLVVNIGDRVFFGYDRFDLSDEARQTLDKQAQWLSQYQNINVIIGGHADERGTREYNLALSDRRANAIKNYLVALGVSPLRMTAIGYGKEQPAVLGADPSSWAQNRRGVTRVE